MGFIICYNLCEKALLACLSLFILNIDHYILFAAKICILLQILHGLNYKPTGIPPFLRYFEILPTPGYSVAQSTFVYEPIFLEFGF